MNSFKYLFARSLSADSGRQHLAAHSHHLWPDAAFDGHLQAAQDAIRLADSKWDRVMGEVYSQAQAEAAAELNLSGSGSIVFAPNTHAHILALVSGRPNPNRRFRVLSTDSEFHSFRRQIQRWVEAGWLDCEIVSCDPFDTFADRFFERANSGDHDLIFTSHVFFNSGRVFTQAHLLAALARPEGPWVVVDGYHSFMALPVDWSSASGAFFLAGGYKYAMCGEGAALMYAPDGYGPRPEVTGWFAEFADLSAPPGRIGYANDAMRFMGATFDPSGLYRFLWVRRMLAREGLTTAAVSDHVEALKSRLLQGFAGPLARAELLNPPNADEPQARFLAFRLPDAARVKSALAAKGVVTDVRADVLRIGFGLYHDEADVDRFTQICAQL